MKGHSEPDRASSFSPLLHSPHHLLSLFQPSFSQEQNNKLNWEKTREVCPHLWHPLKGCYWKRIQKCEEGFCVSLFLEALGGLCAPNLERLEWSFLHRSHSLVATTKKTLPIACHASEFRGFEKTLNRACDFFSLVFFFFLPLPSPAALFSAQCFSSVAHNNPSSWYQSEGSRRPGYLGSQENLTEQVTRARQRNRFLWKFLTETSLCSSPQPPPCISREACFFWSPKKQLPRHPGPHLWRRMLTNSVA